MPWGVKVGPFMYISRQRSGPGVLAYLAIGAFFLVALAWAVAWPFIFDVSRSRAWVFTGAYWGALVVAIALLVIYWRGHGQRYTAALSEAGAVTWRCEHRHKSLAEARACTAAHLRTSPAAAPKPPVGRHFARSPSATGAD